MTFKELKIKLLRITNRCTSCRISSNAKPLLILSSWISISFRYEKKNNKSQSKYLLSEFNSNRNNTESDD